MTELAEDRVEEVVAAALCRTTLLTRAVAGITAAAVGLLVVGEGRRSAVLIGVLAGTTAVQIAVLTRRPAVVKRWMAVLVVDSVLLLVVMALSQGGMSYFVYAAGSAALAGVLLGLAALPLWVAQTLQGFVVCAVVLRYAHAPTAMARFVLAAPMAGILAGIGAALASRALTRQIRLSVSLITSAQRSAAALERARLARELHDSVAKTLRAMSLAAVALPGSLRRQPALAEQLADAISRGAHAASREARELIDGLRLDAPDKDFGQTLDRICRLWSAQTGIATRATVTPVEPPVPVRYELARILQEALTNVARHADATRVEVTLARHAGTLTLTVRDDGRGFAVPDDLTALQHSGHVGIVGMTERARAVGGELSIASAYGRSTVVRVRVPA